MNQRNPEIAPPRRMTRRHFGILTGAAGLAAATPGAGATAAPEPPEFRVIAYNIYNGKGWPGDRTSAKKAVERGQFAARLAMELALHDPDLVNFSESPAEKIVREVAERLGMNHVRFPSGGNWPGTILSRFPVEASQNVPLEGGRPDDLFTRHWGTATIRLSDADPLIVHSAHLHPADDPAIRLREVRAMCAAMKPDLAAGRSMLLIGDLNHRPESEEYALWKEAGWTDTFIAAGGTGGLTIQADTPSKRIDYILAAGPIAGRVLRSRPLFEGAFRLNPDDPAAFALSDHLPQFAAFRKE